MTLDLSTLKSAKVDPNEPHMRILKCFKCRTLEVVPDYDGPKGGENTAEYDLALKFFTDPHVNGKCTRDDCTTVRFPTRFWIIPTVKESIEQQLKEGAQGLDVFGTNAYAMKNNFQADAMTCWVQHQQTKDCSDYKSEKKLIKPDTAKERLDAGLEKESRGPKVYLCDYCPVKSVIQEKAFKKMGHYKQ
jgi:hypothetical protein